MPSGYHGTESADLSMWAIMVASAAGLGGSGATYHPASAPGWCECIDGEEPDPLTGRRLPVGDLLANLQTKPMEARKHGPPRRAALHVDFLLRGRRASAPNEGAVAERRLFRSGESSNSVARNALGPTFPHGLADAD